MPARAVAVVMPVGVIVAVAVVFVGMGSVACLLHGSVLTGSVDERRHKADRPG